MTIKKTHYISGLIITLFVGFHLFNHAISVFGIDHHLEMMSTLRLVYRNWLIETVILLAVFVQIISGLKLFKINRKTATSSFDKLHVWSGLYLALFFLIHVSAVLGGRYLLKLDTNFYFGVAGINTFPYNLFFIPYYSLAIILFFGHIAAIHHKKMQNSILGISPTKQPIIILILGIIFTVLIFYGLTNHFKGVSIPNEYGILIGK